MTLHVYCCTINACEDFWLTREFCETKIGDELLRPSSSVWIVHLMAAANVAQTVVERGTDAVTVCLHPPCQNSCLRGQKLLQEDPLVFWKHSSAMWLDPKIWRTRTESLVHCSVEFYWHFPSFPLLIPTHNRRNLEKTSSLSLFHQPTNKWEWKW